MSCEKVFAYVAGPYGNLATMAVNFRPENKGRVIFAHGFSPSATMSESSKLFIETAETLAKENIGALLFDFTGNGLSDGFFHEMTPNRRIAEMVSLIDHVAADYSGRLFLLGLSMGGAVSIHAAARRSAKLAGLVTWSCVPSFALDAASAHWFRKTPDESLSDSVGRDFYTDRPDESIAGAYASLRIPKLQIQGDRDYAFFAEEFKAFFDLASEPKELIILPEGDHVFVARKTRTQVIGETAQWIGRLCQAGSK